MGQFFNFIYAIKIANKTTPTISILFEMQNYKRQTLTINILLIFCHNNYIGNVLKLIKCNHFGFFQ